jgi:hypothetical protein
MNRPNSYAPQRRAFQRRSWHSESSPAQLLRYNSPMPLRSTTLALLVLTALLLGACAAKKMHEPSQQAGQSGKYQIGQRWSIKGRPNDPQPEIVIGRIDKMPHGDVVHVSVLGVRIANPRSPGGVNEEVPHLPMAAAALDASVVALQGTGKTAAEFEEGYAEWRKAEGGAFTIPITQCLDILEKTLASAPADSK